MRTPDPTKSFKKDLKREKKGIYRKILDGELWEIIDTLAMDIPLPYPYHDHALHHNWEGSRECHIRPDFLLIYTYEGDDILRLERLGDHSKLFGL